MVELKKIQIKESILKTVTKENNVFDYVKKVKNHFGRAKVVLLKSIPNIKDRLIFASDFKSIELDNSLIGEIELAYSEATGTDKALISKAKHSLSNILIGKETTNSEW